MDSIERAAEKLARNRESKISSGISGPKSSLDAHLPQESEASPKKEPGSAVPPRDTTTLGPSGSASEQRTIGSGPKVSPVEIDTKRLGRMGFVSPDQPVSRVGEEFRVLKHRVLHNAFNESWEGESSPRLIMVTSAQPGEGKSYTAVNLALSIASERDTRVLLIDGDFLHPSVFKSLNLKRPMKGFLDVVEDDSQGFESVILSTNINHLSLIDAGRSNALASEYLSSRRMQQLCDELVERYQNRIIIFDSSPVLASSEPSVLSHHMGQILFVVEARRSTHGSVRAGLDMIHDTSKVMMLLNKSRLLAGTEAFGGYYNYYRNSRV